MPILEYLSPKRPRPSGIIGAALIVAVPLTFVLWHRGDFSPRKLSPLPKVPAGVQPLGLAPTIYPPIPTEVPLSVQAIDLGAGAVVNGSGFLVASGVLVTTAHNVVGNVPIAVTSIDHGINLSLGRVLDDDPASDLALVAVLADAGEPQPAPLRLSTTPAAPRQAVRVLSRFGITPATVIGPFDDPATGAVLLLDAPGLCEGASGAAVIDHAGEVLAVVRGAVDDDAGQVVAVPVDRLRVLLDSRHQR